MLNRDRAEMAAQFIRELLEANTQYRPLVEGGERAATYDTNTDRCRDDLRADIEDLLSIGVRACGAGTGRGGL